MDEPACRQQALNLLARREHSRLELERKLSARSYPDAVISVVLDALEAAKLLDSARFTESFIRSRVSKGHGPVRIRRDLAERGIASAESADFLRDADIDWYAAAKRARSKKFGDMPMTDFKQRARQSRFLQYRGFTIDQIKAALDLNGEFE
jgi:regulatory protein